MGAILWLTVTEIVRRRIPVTVLAVCLLLAVGLVVPLQGALAEMPRADAERLYSSLYLFFGTNIIKFFASAIGILLASGAISAELDRGLLAAIVPKPVSRLDIYAGKWLGIVLFLAVCVLLWDGVLYGVARYRAPQELHIGVWTALPCLLLYPVVFVSMALFFSVFANFLLACGLTLLLTGVGWAEGTFHVLGNMFHSAALDAFSKAAGWCMPVGRMARCVSDAMGPLPGLSGVPPGQSGIAVGNAFEEIVNGPWALLYVLLYAAAFFGAGAALFARREV